uniref:SH2 domain-containing protein n=1 Tax=Macrostomum lignano TaxID=282301 RepID=A0A1I8IQ96_9PLAT
EFVLRFSSEKESRWDLKRRPAPAASWPSAPLSTAPKTPAAVDAPAAEAATATEKAKRLSDRAKASRTQIMEAKQAATDPVLTDREHQIGKPNAPVTSKACTGRTEWNATTVALLAPAAARTPTSVAPSTKPRTPRISWAQASGLGTLDPVRPLTIRPLSASPSVASIPPLPTMTMPSAVADFSPDQAAAALEGIAAAHHAAAQGSTALLSDDVAGQLCGRRMRSSWLGREIAGPTVYKSRRSEEPLLAGRSVSTFQHCRGGRFVYDCLEQPPSQPIRQLGALQDSPVRTHHLFYVVDIFRVPDSLSGSAAGARSPRQQLAAAGAAVGAAGEATGLPVPELPFSSSASGSDPSASKFRRRRPPDSPLPLRSGCSGCRCSDLLDGGVLSPEPPNRSAIIFSSRAFSAARRSRSSAESTAAEVSAGAAGPLPDSRLEALLLPCCCSGDGRVIVGRPALVEILHGRLEVVLLALPLLLLLLRRLQLPLSGLLLFPLLLLLPALRLQLFLLPFRLQPALPLLLFQATLGGLILQLLLHPEKRGRESAGLSASSSLLPPSSGSSCSGGGVESGFVCFGGSSTMASFCFLRFSCPNRPSTKTPPPPRAASCPLHSKASDAFIDFKCIEPDGSGDSAMAAAVAAAAAAVAVDKAKRNYSPVNHIPPGGASGSIGGGANGSGGNVGNAGHHSLLAPITVRAAHHLMQAAQQAKRRRNKHSGAGLVSSAAPSATGSASGVANSDRPTPGAKQRSHNGSPSRDNQQPPPPPQQQRQPPPLTPRRRPGCRDLSLDAGSRRAPVPQPPQAIATEAAAVVPEAATAAAAEAVPPTLPPRTAKNAQSKLAVNFLENLSQLKRKPWYFGPLSSSDAEEMLNNRPDGTFLVRDSAHDAYIVSLSFRARGQTYHTRIEHNKGKFSFWTQPENHSASTIVEFIESAVEYSKTENFHYFVSSSTPGTQPIRVSMLYPLSRFSVMTSLQHLCRDSGRLS